MACATVLGAAAWNRLPEAVRERFADSAGAATYAGSLRGGARQLAGLAFAWLGRLFGTPVTPRTGQMSPAACWCAPGWARVAWDREYHWADGSTHLVRSTKVVTGWHG